MPARMNASGDVFLTDSESAAVTIAEAARRISPTANVVLEPLWQVVVLGAKTKELQQIYEESELILAKEHPGPCPPG